MAKEYQGRTYDEDWFEIDAMGNRLTGQKDWAANAAVAAVTPGALNPYTNLPGASIMDKSGAIPGNEPGSTLQPVGPGGWQAGVLGGSGSGGATGGGTSVYGGAGTNVAAQGGVPVFDAPEWTKPADFVYDKQFVAPTADDLYKDPSYQWRLDQGAKALQNSAAAKGLMGSSGTLKGLVDYGQNAASQEYGNVYNRMFGEYKFDYDKAADIYDINYKGSKDQADYNYKAAYDEYQPKYGAWTTNTNNAARMDELKYETGWKTGENALDRAGDKEDRELERRRIEQADWR